MCVSGQGKAVDTSPIRYERHIDINDNIQPLIFFAEQTITYL